MARTTRRPNNLPAEATSFVGRRRELAELKNKLAAVRLVSLVGPGGVGKSRLAVRIATDLARAFKYGAWLVELAEVRDPGLVVNAALAALDLRDQAATEPLAHLLSYLRDKELLLVVDNCEHLLEAAAALVSAVINAAPGVRMIATSREPLSVQGEHVVPVPPLELPAADERETLAQVRQNEAVMLFTERAAAASGRFELTVSNHGAVANLCRRLDGLPLAIELAAVRTRVLTAEQLLERLSDRFGLLRVGSHAALPRHQTLQTTIDWSHDLLSSNERTLLRRLCVFAGRFTLEDVEGICASEDLPTSSVLDLLSSLVDKSLVIKEDSRRLACYRLHETMREYASLKLREAGEVQVTGQRCGAYYRSRCQQSEEQARHRLAEWLEWMELEIDNIRAVLRHCLTQADIRLGLDLASALYWYWVTRGTAEGVRWLDELLASEGGTHPTYTSAYYLRGFLANLQADPSAARPWFERAAAAARASGQVALLSRTLSQASIAENMAGQRLRAKTLLDEAEALAVNLDDVAVQLGLLQARTLGALLERALDAARSASAEGVRLSREANEPYRLEMMLMNQGSAALMAGDLDASKPALAESLRIARSIDDRIAQYYLLDALGCHAAGVGKARLAAQLLGAAETVRTGAGARLIPTIAPLIDQARESAVAALGRSQFEKEFAAGTRLMRDRAVGLALGEPSDVAATALRGTGAKVLGNRQAEVARLVAGGLSNKQIGARLFISEYTVDSHVRGILNKLGFSSRVQIAAWIASSNEQLPQ